MKKIRNFSLAFTASCLATSVMAAQLPEGFVYVHDIAPSIKQDIKYFSSDNFVGRPIKGYMAARCILSKSAANAISQIQSELVKKSLSLKIFDCYRPQQAVNDFVTWSKDINDQKNKLAYYPNVDKSDLFAKGYIAGKSGHSRGSTVDLTVVLLNETGKKYIPGTVKTNGELDMGTHFDWFGIESHTDSQNLPKAVRENRQWFKKIMAAHGFKNLPEEWWHFTLENEPYPTAYFNFPVL